MEAKINIVEILKDKPQGTKLYSSACGKCKLEEVDDKSFKISFYNSKFGFMNGGEGYLDKNGKLYDDGECVVFPSKEMRDWSKFAWKKGDVLVSEDGTAHLIFEKFTDDTYTTFIGKYHYANNDYYVSECDSAITDLYTLETENSAQTYINTIEERLGGKLNRESLEIEKQTEFKDGDIVCISGMGYLAYGIVKSIDNSSKKLEYYVLNDMSTLKFEDWLSFEDKHIQPITEIQQIILFDALEKEGKRWDAEKKQIVDLKPKIELKPFDKVLSRRCSEDYWVLNFYSHKSHKTDYHICIDGSSNLYCIPYNEETAHLLGTTDEWKGGEG
jgi:hypothetical protein